jgi:hypothetical protein
MAALSEENHLQTSAAVEASRRALDEPFERADLKGQLLRTCAACNRGFGASAMDRSNVDSILARLSELNPCAEPTAGVTGCPSGVEWVGRGFENRDDYASGFTIGAQGPLDGVWRLIYTNASDVLSLDVNPIAGVGPISQEITLPDSVVNVIDLYPRAASLLPLGALRTTTRLRVATRASARSATRIGLTFERVGIEARALLGLDLSKLLPALSIPLPRIPGSNTAGADSDTSPAFFEVGYLDQDMLLILQNQPGGAFVLVRETENEMRMRTDPSAGGGF